MLYYLRHCTYFRLKSLRRRLHSSVLFAGDTVLGAPCSDNELLSRLAILMRLLYLAGRLLGLKRIVCCSRRPLLVVRADDEALREIVRSQVVLVAVVAKASRIGDLLGDDRADEGRVLVVERGRALLVVLLVELSSLKVFFHLIILFYIKFVYISINFH